MRRTAAGCALAAFLLAILLLHGSFAGAVGAITSPRDRASVRGQVPIEGAASDPSFQKYEIHYGPEPNPGDQWTPLQGSPFTVPVVQGRLGLWDTTLVPDGTYSLRLRTVRLDGNYDEFFVRGIQVVNARPTDTPVPAATRTPAGPTRTPAPTATIVVAVPTVASPTPLPTDTPLPTGTPEPTPEPVKLPFGITGIGDAAVKGAEIVAAVFAGIGLLFVLRAALTALFRRLTGRDRDELGA